MARRGVILVGHSSSGAVITGVADRAPERIAHATKLPRTFIRCGQFANPRLDAHAEMARRTAGWHYRELAAPHHAAITLPDRVAALLLELGS